jgi:hypothetical protein
MRPVGSGNDRQLNLLEVRIARRDQMWLSTRWLKIYTGSDKMPYVKSGISRLYCLRSGARESLGELQAFE